MKQIIYRMCIAILLCAIATGCEDNFENMEGEHHLTDYEYSDNPLKLSPAIKIVAGLGGTYRCTVYAEKQMPWKITGLPSWLTASQIEGTGNMEITFSAKENPSSSAERSANLTLESTLEKFPVKMAYNVYQCVQPEATAVDLGLSVKWATCNVGANSPEEYGGYYAWGEVEEKEVYSWGNYKWGELQSGEEYVTKYNTQSKFGTVDNKTTLDPEDDVAHVRWGGSWRMPTKDEIEELVKKCIWEWTTKNGIKGYLFTGPNGNKIFLPAAGRRYDDWFADFGRFCYFRSASLFPKSIYGSAVYSLYFHYNSAYKEVELRDDDSRDFGHSVRPVTD